MSLFRSTRSFVPVTRRRFALPIQQQRFATQDYGSGDGNPAGENPQDQGTSQIARDLEHPGPAAPSAGQKGGSSSSSRQGEKGASSTESKSSNGARPKILNESPPKDSEASADVQQHNREMDQRADRANEKVGEDDVEKDKVGKEFWKGTGGVDEKVQKK